MLGWWKRAGRRASGVVALWALLVGMSLLLRPPLPVDETRYLAVAWEMWVGGDFLVPRLNGVPYSDKPPLLFWLFHAGWRLFGVNAWWPRLVPALFGLASLGLVGLLARRLWPGRPEVARAVPLVLLGCLLWTVYTTLLMFDLLVAAFTLLALHGLLSAWRGRALAGFGLAGAAAGLGLLAKGPIALVAPGAVIALAPWWGGRTGPPGGWWRWAAGALASLLLAAGIGLAWALPAAAGGGEAYGAAILFRQTGERLVDAANHARPWWWYTALLPLSLYPYSLWPPLWKLLRSLRKPAPDPGVRFCVAWGLPGFLFLSWASGKQPHYLLPLLPAAALLVARGTVDAASSRREAALPGLLLAVVGGAVVFAPRFGLEPPDWAGAASPWAGAVLVLLAAGWVAGCRRLFRCRPEGLVALSVLLVVGLHAAFTGVVHLEYDAAPIALRLRRQEAAGRPIAFTGDYQGQFHFGGRLRHPFEEISPPLARDWLRRHADGLVVDERATLPPWPRPVFFRHFRDRVIAVWKRGPLPPDLGGRAPSEGRELAPSASREGRARVGG